jgi:hypothetical protein
MRLPRTGAAAFFHFGAALMTQRMTCLQGHEWQPSNIDSVGAGTTLCPVCGSAGCAATSSGPEDPSTALRTRAVPSSSDPATRGTGWGFWVAVFLVIGAGVASFFAVPVLFPKFNWLGSSELSDKKTLVVHPGETQRLQWDNPRVETATVAVNSPGSPVNVFLLSEPDVDAALRTMNQGMLPTHTLAARTWVENVTVEIKPGRKPFVLLLQTNAPRAEVTVSVRGR